jgi:hypothetical protein
MQRKQIGHYEYNIQIMLSFCQTQKYCSDNEVLTETILGNHYLNLILKVEYYSVALV